MMTGKDSTHKKVQKLINFELLRKISSTFFSSKFPIKQIKIKKKIILKIFPFLVRLGKIRLEKPSRDSSPQSGQLRDLTDYANFLNRNFS